MSKSNERFYFRVDRFIQLTGSPAHLGVTWLEDQRSYNFAIYSTEATGVYLLFYDGSNFISPLKAYTLRFPQNKTSHVWHILVPEREIAGAKYYGFKIAGPYNPSKGQRYDCNKILLDPYCFRIFFPPQFSRAAASNPGANDGQAPLGILPPKIRRNPRSGLLLPQSVRHTHDLVIYEMHIRNFTRHPSSGLDDRTRGTYEGVIQKIPYLQDLGITAVELMPIYQYDPSGGYGWGYMPMGFFAPHHGYAKDSDPENASLEFREMVDALHRAGIEVILDVVYNHTTEGNETGPTYSFRGLDNSAYYALQKNDLSKYVNHSQCGNDMHTSHPATRRLVTDSLNFWALEMGVDGFRFDLASIFMRNNNGDLDFIDPPIISEISSDPDMADLRLIAEPWQGEGGEGYVLGQGFPGLVWRQWNGKFRDDIRSFVKGDSGIVPSLMTRLHGSTDLFPDDLSHACRPYQTVNYIDSHDGLCLYDLVAYTDDGQRSWDCGWHGDNGVPPEVLALRRRQLKNFTCLLLISNGTPMFVAGDEGMRTQKGDGNPYGKDDDTVWLDWNRTSSNKDIFRFFKMMIAFRKAHRSIGRAEFWDSDVHWYGVAGDPDLSVTSHSLAFWLDGSKENDRDIYVMINAYWQALEFAIQQGNAGEWVRVVDTSLDSPHDILDPGQEEPVTSLRYSVAARSVVLLIKKKAKLPPATSLPLNRLSDH